MTIPRTSRHLLAVPDDPSSIIEGALLDLVEETLALKIHDRTAFWNVETEEIIFFDVATAQEIEDAAAAEERHLARVAAGEPLPDHVRRMQAALHRALAREDRQ